jgi:hypothetical protein
MALTRILYGSGALAIGILCAAFLLQGRQPSENTAWEEIPWPFARDAWPPGRAFRCNAAACNKGVEVYVRPKIGFCNCTAGVSSDDEVDRVTDLDLISERFSPSAAGKEVDFAGLPGRSRHYTVEMPDGEARAAAGLAVSHRCDVIVAVTQGQSATSAEQERAALRLLSSGELARWVRSSTEGL